MYASTSNREQPTQEGAALKSISTGRPLALASAKAEATFVFQSTGISAFSSLCVKKHLFAWQHFAQRPFDVLHTFGNHADALRSMNPVFVESSVRIWIHTEFSLGTLETNANDFDVCP